MQLAPLRVVFNTRPIAALIGYSAETHPEMTLDTVQVLLHPDDEPRMRKYVAPLRTPTDGDVTDFRHRMRAASCD